MMQKFLMRSCGVFVGTSQSIGAGVGRPGSSPAAEQGAWWSVDGGAVAAGPAHGSVGQAGHVGAGVFGLVVVEAFAGAVAVFGLALGKFDDVVELAALGEQGAAGEGAGDVAGADPS